MSDIRELRRCHHAWQKARQEYFERLDETIAGAPMDWESMTASVISLDKCLQEFMGTVEHGSDEGTSGSTPGGRLRRSSSSFPDQ